MSTANPLTVMDFEIAELAGLSDIDDQGECELRRRESDLREARAAVAELIEAAAEARKIIAMACVGNTLRAQYRDSRAKPALHALDDALARVGGA